MKKIRKLCLFFGCVVVLFVLSIIPCSSVKAYSIGNFGVSSIGVYDDLYTDVNGYQLNIKCKGYYTIDTTRHFFLCWCSSNNNKVVLSTTYVFTSDETIVWEDDAYANIYDSEIIWLVSQVNNYLLNNSDYETILGNSEYYILNNYVNTIGYIHHGQNVGLLTTTYEGIYNDFVTNVGVLNSSYFYGDLIGYIYNYYDDRIINISSDYAEELEEYGQEEYLRGYQAGLDNADTSLAFEQGKKAGYTQAIEEGREVTSYVYGLWDTMMNGIREMFDVDILGINLSAIIIFVLSIGVIGFVIRRLF